MRPKKIISGGQTGADQAGLFAAQTLGIATGGWAPKGWMTEEGPAPWLADFGLFEAKDGYAIRTSYNVHDADATVLFGRPEERGSALTLKFCRVFFSPWLINPTPAELRQAVIVGGIQTLNIAGNRESINPGIFDRTFATILEAFE